MKYKELKQGTFRWRKKYRHLPTREMLVKDIGVDWLANRVDNIMYRHIFDMLPTKVKMIRIEQWEFTYIIMQNTHYASIEIIQNKPFAYADIY